MIERKLIKQKLKEYQIQHYISSTLQNSGHSHTKLQQTPLGEKVVVFTSRPGIIVGRKGQNIKKLTQTIKKRFAMENPQLEIAEVKDVNLNAQIVAERIAQSMERFGSQRFKGIVHRVMQDSMQAKAKGIEVVISGKVPSTRAKSWRFYAGYLKKCGDIALTGVNKAYAKAKLKSGVIGIKVSIMPPSTKLPDDVTFHPEGLTAPDEPVEEAPKKGKKGKRKSSKKPKKTEIKRVIKETTEGKKPKVEEKPVAKPAETKEAVKAEAVKPAEVKAEVKETKEPAPEAPAEAKKE